MTEESKIEDKIARLSKHFKREGSGLTAEIIEKQAQLQNIVTDKNKDLNVHATFFKYGIHTNHVGKRNFYALPCSLDSANFDDPITLKSIENDLISERLEMHDLPMEYIETGFLRKFNFDSNKWEPAQEDFGRSSSDPSFKFMPKKAFFDLFMDDHTAHKQAKYSALSVQQDERNVPDPPL